MNLHEYQAKEIFKKYGLPVGEFEVSTKATGIGRAAYDLAPGPYAVKCQVHSGARGKAGGVKVVQTPAEAEAFAAKWLGRRLVTRQSGPHGKPVNKILIERAVKVQKEIYVSCAIDRAKAALVVLASPCGGMSIEEVAKQSPEKIFREEIDLLVGPEAFQGRELAYRLGLEGKQVNAFAKIYTGIVRMFLDNDLSLVEINPLALLGTQVVSGTNYLILGTGHAVVQNPVTSLYVATVYEDLQGNCKCTDVSQFDLLAYVG